VVPVSCASVSLRLCWSGLLFPAGAFIHQTGQRRKSNRLRKQDRSAQRVHLATVAIVCPVRTPAVWRGLG
jgi:hypothetical protein